MNWRTDKPTAEVILAKIKTSGEYWVLFKRPDGQSYWDNSDNPEPIPIDNIEKWMDLEANETPIGCITDGLTSITLSSGTDYCSPLQQEQQEIDLETFAEKMDDWKARYNNPDNISINAAIAFTAKMFYQYPNVAREWYKSLTYNQND